MTGWPYTNHAGGQLRRSAVNRSLTPKRRSRVIENDEYAAFIRRAICAYSARVVTGDIDAITAMAAIAADFDTALHQAITGLRSLGYSWTEIAARLGVTRQAAQQHWGGGKLTPGNQRRGGDAA